MDLLTKGFDENFVKEKGNAGIFLNDDRDLNVGPPDDASSTNNMLSALIRGATSGNTNEEPCESAKKFFDLLKDANKSCVELTDLPRELMKENLEVHARAQAAAREKSIALEAEVDKLKEQIAQEAAEREREKEENRRRMQEELENAKINLREEMKQEFLNMLAQHKEGAMIMSTLQNNASTQVAPIIEEEDETGGHENENEDGLQETQPGSVVTVQKGAPAPTRSTRSTAPPSIALFNENTANVTASKTYITSQQLMNRTRNNHKRRKWNFAKIPSHLRFQGVRIADILNNI
ncbi:unnamed protein product [Miscanthus lutarioriparius]|uniref:Uncharacterized protein n=1 Tax=Miscanthus lutarioriparius TaxID=422564 RepID=A0A811PSI1_9POAL|nr:unnamed protein product [Miscanthus lutarioriparius]